MRDTKMVKAAGEHWVCAELARRGWAPALTRDGLERTDILAVGTHLPDRTTIEVQVKTATGISNATRWALGIKAQHPALSDREWFALVLLPAVPMPPRCFIVPRDHVAAGAWISHMSWLTDSTVAPGTRNAPVDQARVKAQIFARYEQRWDLLDQVTGDAPVMLPPRYRDLAKDDAVGLPPAHPWQNALPHWESQAESLLGDSERSLQR